jgi:hypothetical protein
MGALVMTDGRTQPLRERHLVGRDPRHADLHLAGNHVSGRHAELRWHPGAKTWRVRDLHSKNGSWLNGVALPAGDERPVATGDTLGFGTAEAAATLLSSEPPSAFAVLVDGVRSVQANEGVLELPDTGAPEVCVFRSSSGGWVCESSAGTAPLYDRSVVKAATHSWRVHLPNALPVTATLDQGAWSLQAVGLVFRVSHDEEDIELTVHSGSRDVAFAHRSHHTLLLQLARERLADASNHDVSPRAHGWIDRQTLLDDLRITPSTLDQFVHRARKQLEEASVDGARRVVERRRGSGALRIGAARLEVRPL